MALDKVVDSAALDAGMKSVADAIRAKGGTTDPLAFPDGFMTAIEAISGGEGKEETGEFIGEGIADVYIPLTFEPDIIYVRLTDVNTVLETYNHLYGAVIVRDTCCVTKIRGAGLSTISNSVNGLDIDGLYAGNQIYAEYTNGILHCVLKPGSRLPYNGASYTWKARKW